VKTTHEPVAQLERRLGRLFAIGLALTATALASGLIVFLVAPRAPAGPRLLSLGLVILMATPLLRVVVSVLEYLRIRDWFFVAITAVVLLQLTVTMIVALW
jgi:uncharacterized membrane protein